MGRRSGKHARKGLLAGGLDVVELRSGGVSDWSLGIVESWSCGIVEVWNRGIYYVPDTTAMLISTTPHVLFRAMSRGICAVSTS